MKSFVPIANLELFVFLTGNSGIFNPRTFIYMFQYVIDSEDHICSGCSVWLLIDLQAPCITTLKSLNSGWLIF